MSRSRSPRLFALMSVLAALCGPACAAGRTPAHRTAPAVTPVDQARVIVEYRPGAALRREAMAQRDGSHPVSAQQALKLGHDLGLALVPDRALGSHAQLVHAAGIGAQALAAKLRTHPDVAAAWPDERRRVFSVPNDELYAAPQATPYPPFGQWYLRAPASGLTCTNNITGATADCPTTSAINAEAAWDISTGSAAVVVADIDTGVRPEHPDLAGQVLPGLTTIAVDNNGGAADQHCITGNGSCLTSSTAPDATDPGDWVSQADLNAYPDLFVGSGCLSDSSWHGTQTAGLLAAKTDNALGIASVGRNVQLLPIRALGKCGGFDSDIQDAMRWAVGLPVTNAPVNAHPAQVINMSLGGAGVCGSYAGVISEVKSYAASQGRSVTIVVASGNDSLAVEAPGNCPGVVAVSAVRSVGDKVAFSNLGPEVALSAPGGNCVFTNPGDMCQFPMMTTFNDGLQGPGASSYTDGLNVVSLGTSFSAPLVSGVAALMLSVNPQLTEAQVLAQLQATARSFPTTGGTSGTTMCTAPTGSAQNECYCTTSTCGAGMLDAGAAVLAARDGGIAFVLPSGQPVAGSSFTVGSDGTISAAGTSIAGYQWSITNGTASAAISGSASGSSVTVLPKSGGRFTLTLVITDSAGGTVSRSKGIDVMTPIDGGGGAGGGGGGGAVGPLWGLALLLAWGVLRAGRRR